MCKAGRQSDSPSKLAEKAAHLALLGKLLAQLGELVQLLSRVALAARLEVQPRQRQAQSWRAGIDLDGFLLKLECTLQLPVLGEHGCQGVHDEWLVRREPVRLLGELERLWLVLRRQHPGEVVERHRVVRIQPERSLQLAFRFAVLALADRQPGKEERKLWVRGL